MADLPRSEMQLVIPPLLQTTIPVIGGGLFPVRRIFCVGRNYADHVKEMGGDPKSVPPTFFSKPADSIHLGGDLSYPMATQDLHYEVELVVALKSGGVHISHDSAAEKIFGYAVGCDVTRRDLQRAAKKTGSPWDTAKAVDHGAIIGPITPHDQVLTEGMIKLEVNGQVKQQSNLSKMIWSLPDIINTLSTYFELKPGDLIYTGTPEGVGPMVPGDHIYMTIDDLQSVEFTITE